MAHHRLHQRRRLAHECPVLAYDRLLAKERPHPANPATNARQPVPLLAVLQRVVALSILSNTRDELGRDEEFQVRIPC